MAEIEKKQKRWYAKSTFNSLDKTTIPVGTEIQVTGELGQADFDNDTNTKLNTVLNKLDKPTGEITEDSIPVISSTGTVSAKPLSELKIYHHGINMKITWHNFSNEIENIYFEFYDNNSAKYTIGNVNTLITKLKNRGIFNCVGGTGDLIVGQISITHTGIQFTDSSNNVNITLYEIPFSTSMGRTDIIGANGAEITSFTDTVTGV